VRLHVRAPATSANLGPGFDVAGVALDLWNELEVGDADGPVDEEHLGVRAFARFASPAGRSFRFTDRIPRERGLGSSAAVVALGLVAGALAAGADPTADELLAEGLQLEGHADNLAAALAGGVCLTWDGHVTRIADDLPAAAIAVVPEQRVKTAEARASLPQAVPHADAVFSAVHATLLGAALGMWLDRHYPGKHGWTLALLVAGLAIGCFNAWHWVDKEDKEMREDEETHHD